MGPRACALALVAAVAFPVRAGGVIYVDADAWGANNGLSWFDAFNELTIALGVASAGDEIWVAEGTYIPLGTNDDSFVIPPGVKLLGGFRGTETDSGQRDPAAHITVLDGDVNGDDEPGFVNRSDNRRHVVKAISPTVGTVLDGFVVRGGYAVNTIDGDFGGGLYVWGGSMKVAQCTFIANGAGDQGGGAFFLDCDEGRVYDCFFTGNATHPASTVSGGGAISFMGDVLDVQRSTFFLNLANAATVATAGAVSAVGSLGGSLEASFRDCSFTANAALAAGNASGGACAVSSDTYASFTRCTFHLNQAGSSGPGSGGAISAVSSAGSGALVLTACGLTSNTAGSYGAAIMADIELEVAGSLIAGNSGSAAVVTLSDTTLTLCTIAGNSHADIGAAGVSALGPLQVSGSVLFGNTNGVGGGQQAQLSALAGATVDYSCVEGWDGSIGGTGSFDADPRFMDPDGADDDAGTLDDDYRLRGGSPCIDAGDNTAVPADRGDLDDDGDTGEKMPLDLDLNPRRLDDAGMPDVGNGTAPFVDIGAYEFQGATCVADFNADGAVDTRDVIEFLNAWAAGDGSADIDGNGAVDTRDVIAFLNAWTVGC